MKKKRIVVTGMGLVSCLGTDVDQFCQQLLDGVSGIRPITQFPCDQYPTRFGGEILNFDPGEYIDKKQARRIDKTIAYALVAGKKALEYARINTSTLNKTRCGIIIGSGMGGMLTFYENSVALSEKGPRRVSPFFVPYAISDMPGALLAIELEFLGPNYSISTACATGNNSIIAAANHIRSGDADLMMCGGTEGALIPIGLAGFCACKALSERNDAPTKASRPWDKNRDGFVVSEGSGVIILESLEHAQARKATIYAEYLGGGVSCDAYHITEPRPDGSCVAECIRRALADAEIQPEDVNYINAHSTSTPVGDIAEINALKQVFQHPEKIALNATKSLIGHSLGAAGGLEAIATVKAITEGKIHPTLNLEDPEPDLAFHIPTKAEPLKIKAAISNGFGFGGHNATIVFAPYYGV